MKNFIFLFAFLSISYQSIYAQSENEEQKTKYSFEENISYLKGNEYVNKRCVLDIYFPESNEKLSTLIYFHGGGLKRGYKYIPEYLKEKGIIVVTVNYRFYPQVSVKEIISDGAAAVKWVHDHISDYGGSQDKIFLSGHSAGGYIISMLGLDASYLENEGISPNLIAGLIPLSGHTITHMTAREEIGIGPIQPTIDKMAAARAPRF